MVGEKSFKHLARGLICDYAKLGQEQEFFVSFCISIFFFNYFENIENDIISYDHYDHYDHHFRK